MTAVPLHVVNTHLHHQPFDDESVREPQVRAILAWLRDRGGAGLLRPPR